MKATEYLKIKTTREVKIPSEKTIELPYFFEKEGDMYGILASDKVIQVSSFKGHERILMWTSPEIHFAGKHEEISVNEFMDEYERVAQIIRDLVFKLEN